MALEIQGDLKDEVVKDRHVAPTAAIATSKMAQRVLASMRIPLTDSRVWDAVHTLLPSAGASDDLGLITGTFGTNAVTIETGDLKASGSTTRRCRFLIPLPEDYEAGETVTVRCFAGMKTTIADTAATIDVEAHRVSTTDTTVGSDLVTTAATTINSLSFANKDFTVTPATLNPGDMLEVRVSILVNDAASGTAVIGALGALYLLADLR